MGVVIYKARTIDYTIEEITLEENLSRICGQIFKLLPMKEENKDWIKPLETVTLELAGMAELLPDQNELFSLVCKLEGLRAKGEEIDFMFFRRTIFELCGMVNEIKDGINELSNDGK